MLNDCKILPHIKLIFPWNRLPVYPYFFHGGMFTRGNFIRALSGRFYINVGEMLASYSKDYHLSQLSLYICESYWKYLYNYFLHCIGGDEEFDFNQLYIRIIDCKCEDADNQGVFCRIIDMRRKQCKSLK